MRALQPSDTAGLAAPPVIPSDNLSISLSLTHLKDNGNEDFSSTSESSVHYSSADRLIHSAFNSVEDKSIADYKAAIDKKLHLYRNKSSAEEKDLQITKNNTSFKDLHHVNKSCFVEKVKDYTNLQEIQLSVKEDSAVSVFPHLVADQEINLNDNIYIDSNTSIHLEKDKKRSVCECAVISKDIVSVYDNDITDFCVNGSLEHLDDNTNDEDYSSISISKRSNFLRGIINPNYPGFQHLAHTLTEHFIIHPSPETCDSDLSECEMELSADSFDNIQEVQSFSTTNNNFNERRTISTSDKKILNNNSEEEIVKLEGSTMDISNLSVDTCNGTTNLIKDSHNKQGLVDLDHDLPICLKSRLKLHDFSQDNNSSKFVWDSPSPYSLSIPADSENNRVDANTFNKIEIDNNFGCPTPDILIKNDLPNDIEFKNQCRPDLLQNVNPQLIESLNNKNQKIFGKTTETEKQNNIAYQRQFDINEKDLLDQTLITDEIAVGITPVDIIGDFGQEVEREFGLLVNGYSRLVDEHPAGHSKISCTPLSSEKMADAALSNGVEKIISNISFQNSDNQFMHDFGIEKNNDSIKFPTSITRSTSQPSQLSEVKKQWNGKPNNNVEPLLNIFEDNAVDWYDCEKIAQFETLNSKQESNNSVSNNNLKNDMLVFKPKYKRHSYDERQLPPVAVDYKCSQTRITRKFQNTEKNVKGFKAKVARNNPESSDSHKLFSSKRNISAAGLLSVANRKREEDEIQQYQQLINKDKELILSKSRYSKMSFWAKHLKNSVKERGNKKMTGLHQSKFPWSVHETVTQRIDMSLIAKHIEATNDFEKKRRYDRDEIRKRLAMGFRGDTDYANCNRSMQSGKILPLVLINDISSDNESHSSDSETCPKLSKVAQKKYSGFSNHFTAELTESHPNICRPLSVSYLETKLKSLNNEDKECDFFTKQARLQIEARMALAQAKDMAHIQMEIDRHKQLSSPITDVIRGSLEKVGIQMSSEKRRVSRQMLTDMNIAQLQIIVNDLHTHIENLNESLVHFLMERDDLHVGQDSMLIDIEDLTRYLGAKEQSLEQKENTLMFKRQQ